MSAAATQPTWEELAAAETDLCRLEHLARWMGGHARPSWCANAVWYRFLKPELCRLVGWSRGRVPEPAHDGPRPLLICMADVKPSRHVPATTAAERLLRSRVAYDVAYEHLYALLPDCRHDEEACCG